MQCPNCGYDNTQTSRFCARCGFDVNAPAEPATGDLAPPPGNPWGPPVAPAADPNPGGPVAPDPPAPAPAWGQPAAAPPPAAGGPPLPPYVPPPEPNPYAPPSPYMPPPPGHYAPPGPTGYAQPGAYPPPGYPAPYPPGPGYYGPSTNGLAIASLVLGLVGWTFCGIGSVVAVILGFVSHSQIQGSQGRQSGSGMAKAGIILGFIGIAFWVFLFVLSLATGDNSNV